MKSSDIVILNLPRKFFFPFGKNLLNSNINLGKKEGPKAKKGKGEKKEVEREPSNRPNHS